MIYLGIITAVDAKKATATVRLEQIDQSADVHILQQATGSKRSLNLPNVGDQAVVWCSEEVKVLLGAVYGSDPTPSADLTLEAASQQAVVKLGGMTVDLGGGKLELKSGATSLQSLLNDLATLLQRLKVTTSSGPAPLSPESVAELLQWGVKMKSLLA